MIYNIDPHGQLENENFITIMITAQKSKFFIKDILSKRARIRSF